MLSDHDENLFCSRCEQETYMCRKRTAALQSRAALRLFSTASVHELNWYGALCGRDNILLASSSFLKRSCAGSQYIFRLVFIAM